MGSKFLLTRNPNSIHSLSRIQILTIRELHSNRSLKENIEKSSLRMGHNEAKAIKYARTLPHRNYN